MLYQEIQREIGAIIIAIAEPVTVSSVDYTHQSTDEYIVNRLEDCKKTIERLINNIKTT
jgi:hypothetical protein